MIRPVKKSPSYPVSDIFFSLQGEGHFVGYPMVFVRLAGCSVTSCHIRSECDESPWKMRERLTAEEIAARVASLQPVGIVCITGGEPTDHDLLPLVCALRDSGQRVHLETSGVRSVAGFPLEWLTVSPKVLGARGLVQRSGHTLKFVVRPEWSAAEAWDIVLGAAACTEFFHRYLQPTWVAGVPVNLDLVMKMLLNQDGVGRNGEGRWALGMQSHKWWGLK